MTTNGNGKASWAVGILVMVFLAWFGLSTTGFFHLQNGLASEADKRAGECKVLRELIADKVDKFIGVVSAIDKRLAVIESHVLTQQNGGR